MEPEVGHAETKVQPRVQDRGGKACQGTRGMRSDGRVAAGLPCLAEPVSQRQIPKRRNGRPAGEGLLSTERAADNSPPMLLWSVSAERQLGLERAPSIWKASCESSRHWRDGITPRLQVSDLCDSGAFR